MQRRAKRTLNFTQAAIGKLFPPAKGREHHYDEKQPGLAICVSSSGHKAFYVIRRIGPEVSRICIGSWPQFTIDNARDQAKVILGKVASGINPNAERRAARKTWTLQEAFDYFIALPTRTKHNKRPKSPKTVKEYRQQFDAYLKPWATRRMTSLRRDEIEELHNRLGADNGHYVANRTLVLLRTLANVSIEQGCLKENPTAGIVPFAEVERERYLDANEWPKFWAALEAEPSEKVRDALKIAIFTGQRRGNVLSMKWENVDLLRRVWTITRTKNARPLEVPLSQPAVEVLERRNGKADASGWVFPAHHGSGHLTDPMRAWRDILKRAGIHDLRIHDLRRSLGSWATMGGASERLVGRVLGHLDPAATRIYSRVGLDAARTVVESTATAIMAMADPPKPAKRKKGGAA